MKTDILNFNRLGLLFQRFFGERSRYELIQWLTMTIVFMFMRNNVIGMTIAILVSGVVYASNFYKEIHSSGNGVAYFMIPASQLEKTILGVVITSFYYFAMIIVAYVIGNLLGTLLFDMLSSLNGIIGINLFHYSSLQWNLFDISSAPRINTIGHDSLFILHLFEIFLIGQSVYLLGSIYFKRNHFFATLLSKIIVGLILLIVFAIELRLIFGNFSMIPNHNISYDFGNTFGSILRNIIWLVPPFFWVVSYFRLTEKQV